MREILFRGKTIKTRFGGGKWIEGFYAMSCAGRGEMEPAIITGTERSCFITEFVDPATVGQFTGLCDKNGVKIFEGDIVDIWSAGQHCHGLVKWGQGSVSFFVEVPCTPHIWHLSGGGKNYDEETCEVIGSIHDNPELMEEGAE